MCVHHGAAIDLCASLAASPQDSSPLRYLLIIGVRHACYVFLGAPSAPAFAYRHLDVAALQTPLPKIADRMEHNLFCLQDNGRLQREVYVRYEYWSYFLEFV